MKCSLPALALSAAWLSVVSHASAEFPQYMVIPVSSETLSINNNGELLQSSFTPTGELSYSLAQFPGLAQTGSLNHPPAGWDVLGLNRGRLSEDGKFALEIARGEFATYESEVVVANSRTGTVEILTGTPVNGDDDRRPVFSGSAFTAIQAGPERGQLQPYRYDAVNGWVPLGNLFAGGDGRPLGVNETGTVVGRTGDGGGSGDTIPFIYTNTGGMQAIKDNGTTIYGEARAINNVGLVTGTANGRAYVFDSSTLELTFIGSEANGIHAVDINDAGAVLGVSGFDNSAFSTLWTAENGLIAISSLLLGNEDPFHPTWLVKEAFDINNDGWILATAEKYATGVYYQVLLLPVPEPSILAQFGMTGAWVFNRKRRRGHTEEA